MTVPVPSVVGPWQCLYPILPMQGTASEPRELLKVIEYPLSHYDFGGVVKQELGGVEMDLLSLMLSPCGKG